MTDSMVERVARVMWTAFATEGTYDEDRHCDVPAYLEAARAAIAAMREPTAVMCAALMDEEDKNFLKIGATDPLKAWQLLIDAALSEPVPK